MAISYVSNLVIVGEDSHSGPAENFTNSIYDEIIESIWQIKPLIEYIKHNKLVTSYES